MNATPDAPEVAVSHAACQLFHSLASSIVIQVLATALNSPFRALTSSLLLGWLVTLDHGSDGLQS